MSKQLVNLDGGALVVSEQGGVFTVALDKSVSLGGGAAAGVISVEGQGSVVLSGKQAFDLGMALLEAHSPPALQPLEAGAQAIGDGVIEGL
jgi:hypothetical protein